MDKKTNSKNKKYQIPVYGMHCASCEMLLKEKLNSIEDVNVLKVSSKKNNCLMELDTPERLEKVNEAILELGYHITKDDHQKHKEKKKNTLHDYIQILQIIIFLGAVSYLLNSLEITRYFPNLGGSTSFALAFLVGLIASVSTCFALVGGIVMGFGAKVKAIPSSTKFDLVKPHLYFHGGRIASFVIGGGLLGLFGASFKYSLDFTGYLTIIVAVVMLYLALQILNITRISFTSFLPKGIHDKITKLQNNHSNASAGVIGMLTFFLPCGFTQSMQLAAIASGNFWTGSMILLFFVIGTTPVLFSAGVGSSFVKKAKYPFLTKAVGVMVLFFGLYSLNSGLVLTGSSFNINTFLTKAQESSIEKSSSIDIVDGKQEVHMEADWTYKPSTLVIKPDVPVRWIIEGKNLSGCNNEIIIPSLNISKKLQKGKNIIEFTPPKGKKYIPFSCWMGMISGTFVVADDIETTESQISNEELDIPVPVGGSSCGANGGGCGCGG